MERDAGRWEPWLARLPLIALVGAMVLVTVFVVQNTGQSSTPAASASPGAVQTIPPPASSRTLSFTGPTYDAELDAKPTRDVVQSRVWFHAGAWWAVMLGGSGNGAAEHHIFRLDPRARAWQDTGTLVDERPSAHPDVLDGGDRIYVASGGWGTGPRNALRIYTFGYSEAMGRYSILPGAPATISSTGVRSAVLARDGTGRLWVSGIVDGKILVSHGIAGSSDWSQLAPPGERAAAASVDEATIVAAGDTVAVAWTDPDSGTLVVGRLSAAKPTGPWSEVPIRLDADVGLSGDLSMVLAQDPDKRSRLLVTAEAKYPPGQATGDSADIIVVAVEADGSWRPHILSRIADHQDHPRLLLSADGKAVYSLVTATTEAKGSGIFVKQSPLNPLSFPTSRGAPLVVLNSPAQVDFPSTTSQAVDAAAGLVAIAADPTGTYVTGFIQLGPDLPDPPSLPPPPDEQAIARDTFDSLAVGSPLGSIWQLSQGDTGSIEVADASDAHGRVARLEVGPDGSRTRACRAIPETNNSTLRFSVGVRFSAFGRSDATIAIWADGHDMAAVRFEEQGRLGYFNGATLIDTSIGYRPATWYRAVLTANAASKTYSWGLLDANGKQVFRVAGLRFRVSNTDPLSAVCLETPSGAPGLAVDFDDVVVTR
jgi:hypothetical protein